MDTRGPVTRASKAIAFFHQEAGARYCLFPRPWQLPSGVGPLRDGHRYLGTGPLARRDERRRALLHHPGICDFAARARVASRSPRLVPDELVHTANGWSRYALDTYGYAPVASAHYHRSHIRRFTLLNARTGHAAFGNAAERWNTALSSRSVRCLVLARKCAQVMWMRDVCRLPLVNSIWG